MTKTTEQINEQALALTRAQRTEVLVASFLDTDKLMERPGLTPENRQYLADARGWIIDVLDERGQLDQIGLN